MKQILFEQENWKAVKVSSLKIEIPRAILIFMCSVVQPLELDGDLEEQRKKNLVYNWWYDIIKKREKPFPTLCKTDNKRQPNHIMIHSCSCLCLGTPISSNVFGPVLTGLRGVAGFGVDEAEVGGGVATLLLLSAEGPGLGLDGVAESTLGGRARLGLLLDVCGRARLGLLLDVCGRAECLPDTGFCGAE